ncbi:MAG: cupin domain-containing protein [Pseudomonadota bacterium]
MSPRIVRHYDLSEAAPTRNAQIDFTRHDDQRWAGILELPANAALPLNTDARHDMYLLSGQVSVGENNFSQGTFLSTGIAGLHNDLPSWRAGVNGAVLFAYRDQLATKSGKQVLSPAQLNWQLGGADGMHVATLSETQHRLMLVSWQPGTRMRFHRHPQGEEIFVLKGQLRDERGIYPTGSWQRLYADAGHAPYAKEETLILLRNGHLRS